MFRNYFKTVFRNIWRHKTFSAINIAGLALGMAGYLLILQFVSFELSYDEFHQQGKDIYRVVNDRYQQGKLVQHGTITYSAIGKAMNDDFEEVAANTRMVRWDVDRIITWKDKKLAENRPLSTDNSFLRMFSFPLLAGDVNTVLNGPHEVVITASLSQKIFGHEAKNADQLIGKSIMLDTDSVPYQITGICRDVPQNSHLQFNMLISYQTLISNGWGQANHGFKDASFWHYVQLKPGTDHTALNEKMNAFSQRHFQGATISGSDEHFYLQPLSKAHLYSDFEYEIGNTGNAAVVWSLLLVAIFIIIIAWANYINLATAHATERAKEVGVRKTIGASKRQLVWQFLTESAIINICALLVAFVLVMLLQSWFNMLVDADLSLMKLFRQEGNGYLIILSLIGLVITGMLASGLFPAWLLASFKPVTVLKGKINISVKGAWLRRALVTGQFAITIALIICSIIVYRQVRFMSNKELGFDINQMLVIRPPVLTAFDSTFIERANSFKNEVAQLPNVQGAAISSRIAGDELSRAFNVYVAGKDAKATLTMRSMSVSPDFIGLYSIRLLAGRNFSTNDYHADLSKLDNVIINKSAATMLGFPSAEVAVGRSIVMWGRELTVAGVIDDFHQKSLRYALEPIIMSPIYDVDFPFSIKITTHDVAATVKGIGAKYGTFFPGNLFDYYFLDERFNRQYKQDQLFGRVFGIFAGFAIFIACLGLLGLALFTTAQRTKEIGIRKVLGASVPGIVLLLSKDLTRLILVANIIAFPVAWYVMHNWIEGFAYRTTISWWIFLVGGLLAIVVAWITIGLQAVKAALANPVKSLRSE